jgi:hypothetical protein
MKPCTVIESHYDESVIKISRFVWSDRKGNCDKKFHVNKWKQDLNNLNLKLITLIPSIYNSTILSKHLNNSAELRAVNK